MVLSPSCCQDFQFGDGGRRWKNPGVALVGQAEGLSPTPLSTQINRQRVPFFSDAVFPRVNADMQIRNSFCLWRTRGKLDTDNIGLDKIGDWALFLE